VRAGRIHCAMVSPSPALGRPTGRASQRRENVWRYTERHRPGVAALFVSFLLMTKKEILGLLAPSIVFLWVTVYLFLYADFYTPGEKDQLRAMQQKKVAEMVRKVESGEYPQKLEVILAAVYHQEHDIQDIESKFHADKARRMGWYMLTGIAAQFYVVFRIKAGRKNATAKI